MTDEMETTYEVSAPMLIAGNVFGHNLAAGEMYRCVAHSPGEAESITRHIHVNSLLGTPMTIERVGRQHMTTHKKRFGGCPAMTLYGDLAHENGLPVVREKTAGRHHLSSNWAWRKDIDWLFCEAFRVNLTGGAHPNKGKGAWIDNGLYLQNRGTP